MKADEKYMINGVSLAQIRNRNELRVIRLMPDIIGESFSDFPDTIDIQDIYALTLNILPARYVQQGGMVLREPLSDDQLIQAIREAVAVVKSKPNY